MYLTAANSIANIIHQGGLHCNQPKEMVGGGELGPLLVNNAEDSPSFTTSENTSVLRMRHPRLPLKVWGKGSITR